MAWKAGYALVAVMGVCSAPRPVPVDGGEAASGGGGGGAAADFCAAAKPLTTAPLTANTTTGSSTYTTECGGDGNDLLFRVTLTEAHDVLVTASPADLGMPILALFQRPCAPGALSTLACSDGAVVAYNLPPGEYFALLDSPKGAGGPSELNLILSPPTPPPANDGCAGAQVLTFDGGVARATGDTRPATDADLAGAGTPSCAPTAATVGRDVVYQYTLERAADVTVTLTPHGPWRAALYVTAGCAGPELACRAAAASGPLKLSLPGQAPGTYFVWVDGVAGTTGHAGAGGFALTVTR